MHNFTAHEWDLIASAVILIAGIYYCYRLLDKYLLGEIFDMVRNNKPKL